MELSLYFKAPNDLKRRAMTYAASFSSLKCGPNNGPHCEISTRIPRFDLCSVCITLAILIAIGSRMGAAGNAAIWLATKRSSANVSLLKELYLREKRYLKLARVAIDVNQRDDQ
eukprot:scaffold231876_cov18-Prasinocladus_malaysianus.AAC.1